MNDRVAVAAVFAHQPDGRCSGVQADRNEPDRFRGNLQQKSPTFLRSLRSRGGCWSGVQTDRPAVGAASRPGSVALLARIFDVNITYSFCNGHSGVQSTRVDVNQGGNHKLMALPRRMHFAIRSGARTGRRSKCCETVYSEATRAYTSVFFGPNILPKAPLRTFHTTW